LRGERARAGGGRWVWLKFGWGEMSRSRGSGRRRQRQRPGPGPGPGVGIPARLDLGDGGGGFGFEDEEDQGGEQDMLELQAALDLNRRLREVLAARELAMSAGAVASTGMVPHALGELHPDPGVSESFLPPIGANKGPLMGPERAGRGRGGLGTRRAPAAGYENENQGHVHHRHRRSAPGDISSSGSVVRMSTSASTSIFGAAGDQLGSDDFRTNTIRSGRYGEEFQGPSSRELRGPAGAAIGDGDGRGRGSTTTIRKKRKKKKQKPKALDLGEMVF